MKMKNKEQTEDSPMDRRVFFGASALVAGGIATYFQADSAVQLPFTGDSEASQLFGSEYEYFGKLPWESTPVNKRTGVTVFDAEKAGYNVRFVTYLSRFLLVFDSNCQRWWYSKAVDIPILSSAEEVEAIRQKQFGAFAASVEVGLQDFESGKANGGIGIGGSSPSPSDGPERLMQSLLARYCPTIEAINEKREQKELPPLTEQEEAQERREIKEAKRQIALLFGLLESTQPVEAMIKLLSSIDNGSVASATVVDGGSGYAPGYGPPRVEFPRPKAGDGYQAATGRAVIQPNGQILRVDLENRGFGYNTPPTVRISAPGDDRGVTIPGAKSATAKAYIFKTGVNKGRLSRILIENPGVGYMKGEKILVSIGSPELDARLGGVKATAKAILEYSVIGIEITSPGNGYVVEKRIPIYVEPPPLTARVNMNDPLNARLINPSKSLPATTIPTPQQKGRIASITNSSDPNTFTYRAKEQAFNNGKGGGGGCIGRACYDKPVVAYATAKAESNSFTTFRDENDGRKIIEDEEALIKDRSVSATTGGQDSQLPVFWNGGPKSSSGQLLTLLPPGLGLEFDGDLQRFVLSASADYLDINKGSPLFGGSTRPLDPEFGPRGRSPIDREVQLDLSSYLRFCVSGAICASGVHLMVTPLDVIKTKIQTDPENYPGPISSFQKIVEERGPGGFFNGWIPTFVGFFFWGGFSYSLTEVIRRYLLIASGPQAASLEIQIVLVSASLAAFFGTFVLVPFESVRIRSVAQPDFGKNIFDVTKRMVAEEGAWSLFSAAPPLLLKEVPFAMAKFSIFTAVTRYLYELFPAAQEDIQLSLLVSLIGGIFGGAMAAVISNPADATISEMKKSVSDLSPMDAATNIIERGGYANLMRGLPIRMCFYPLVVSTQFLVYDAIRIYLGVGSDDLKVYLDVLGGALQGEGGPA
jgi:solute carrier family 25 phosphate transporter 3